MKKFLVRAYSEGEDSYEWETDFVTYGHQGVVFPRDKSTYFVPYHNLICIIERKEK